MSINTFVSDLFFNMDHSGAQLYDAETDAFAGYDTSKLHETATWVSEGLEKVFGMPVTPGDLVDDFLARM